MVAIYCYPRLSFWINLHAAFQRDGPHAWNRPAQLHFADVDSRLGDSVVVAIEAAVALPTSCAHIVTFSLIHGLVEHLQRSRGKDASKVVCCIREREVDNERFRLESLQEKES